MKKILVVCVALMLPCSLLFSQESEEFGPSAELTVIPRFDLNGGRDNSVPESFFDLGNTALYTQLEGEITPSLSYSISNHWIQGSDLKALYQGTGHSDTNNWLDWAYLTYNFLDHFYVQGGKDVLFVGGLESDQEDYDMHSELCSSVWNNLPVYQWSAVAGWYNEEETTTISAQIATSPLGEKFFSSGLYSFGLQWRGEYEKFSNLWQLSFVGYEKGKYTPVISLGQAYSPIEDLELHLDYCNKVSDGWLYKGFAGYGAVSWYPIPEKMQIIARVGYEYSDEYADYLKVLDEGFEDDAFKAWVYGGGVQWYPLKNSQDLRVHAIFAHNQITSLTSFNVGVTYNWRIGFGK